MNCHLFRWFTGFFLQERCQENFVHLDKILVFNIVNSWLPYPHRQAQKLSQFVGDYVHSHLDDHAGQDKDCGWNLYRELFSVFGVSKPEALLFLMTGSEGWSVKLLPLDMLQSGLGGICIGAGSADVLDFVAGISQFSVGFSQSVLPVIYVNLTLQCHWPRQVRLPGPLLKATQSRSVV